MADFLLELRCEEIPARMQAKAADDLARLLSARLGEAGLPAPRLTSYVTPRRLALIAHDLPEATQAVREEHKGPRTSAPEQALEGFLRKTGLAKEQLEERDGVWFALVEKPGRATADVLAEAVPAVIRAFPWPKSMRWGEASGSTESLRWVRPLQGIVAILGEELVEMELEGAGASTGKVGTGFPSGDATTIKSGFTTLGHRFHHSGPITIGGAGDYVEKLRACHVIVDQAERMETIAQKAQALAAAHGLTLVEDAGLVAENAGLTEWPVPLLGHFDPAFLEVPEEVIQLTLRINQKYFVLRGADGRLAPAFICTANIDAKDGGAAILAGNGKVLAARLSDARFFWEQDRKTPLAEHAKKLERITFHEKLGTVADKVARVAKLAEWLASEGIVPGCDPALARQAAELCKADLVTEMVGEFPELQGVMGGYYARAEGLPDVVADAIRDHYKPVGQGDDVPTAPVTVAVSLADKLDTLAGFFAIDEKPSGSKDPFALRRAAIGILRILIEGHLRVNLLTVLVVSIAPTTVRLFTNPQHQAFRDATMSLRSLKHLGIDVDDAFSSLVTKVDPTFASITDEARDATASGAFDLLDFFADRLKVQQREAGVRHDLIDAVFALGQETGQIEDDLVRLLSRVKALQAFIGTEDGANLLAGYKRAANILKKEAADESVAPAALSEPAEIALVAALDAAEPTADAAIAREDFSAAMAALATLRAPIDAFFEAVMVNDPDPAKKAARLALLQRIRVAVHKVADFSRIEG